jgi:hypothetical protein
MSTKSMKSSLVFAALLTGGFYGFASPATAATGDVCVAGETVHLTAEQGAVPIAPICGATRRTDLPGRKGLQDRIVDEAAKHGFRRLQKFC